MLALAALLTVTNIPRLANATESPLQLFVFVVGVAFAALIVGIIANGAHWNQKGAASIILDPAGIEVRCVDRPPMRTAWGDSDFLLELMDFRNVVSPSQLSVETPYFILFKGTQSALTAVAFQAITRAAVVHRLSARIFPPTPSYYYFFGRLRIASSTRYEHGPLL